MRLRATPKALALRLDGGETPEDVRRLSLPEGLPLEVEVAGPVAQETLEALLALGRPLTLVPRGDGWWRAPWWCPGASGPGNGWSTPAPWSSSGT